MRHIGSWALALGVLAVPFLAHAHEGHSHTALGTVERIGKTRIDVKDANGVVTSYVLAGITRVFRGETAATVASLKPGDRVVVEFEEEAGVKTAVKIRLGDPQKATRYTCQMHPEVVSDKPGKCPKCGMEMKKLAKS